MYAKNQIGALLRALRQCLIAGVFIITTACGGGSGGGGLELAVLGLGDSGFAIEPPGGSPGPVAPGSACPTGPRFSLSSSTELVTSIAWAGFYGAGTTGYPTIGTGISVGSTTPAVIVVARQNHGSATGWVDFALSNGSNLFFSRNAPVALTTGTLLIPYGLNSFHYTTPGTFVSVTSDSALHVRAVGPTMAPDMEFHIVRSQIAATIEERTYALDLSTSDYSQRGRSFRWSTEKNINLHLIFIDGANPSANILDFAPALQRITDLYAADEVRIRPHFSSTTITDSGLLDVTDFTDETGAVPGSLSSLFAATAAAHCRDAINIIVTKESSAIAGLLGVAGGIPGVIGLPGTPGSALTAFTDAHQVTPGAAMTNDELSFVGETKGHELGHFLGLWHLVERGGSVSGNVYSRDPLLETPACAASSDTNSNGVVDIAECLGTGVNDSGGRNVMFWAGDPAIDQSHFTAEQGAIMRRHPQVY